MKKHIFLVGEKQVGKSTLLQKWLNTAGVTPCGFRTVPWEAGGLRRGFTLHALVPMPPYEEDAVCVVRLGERKHTAVLETFETIGVAILEKSLLSDAPILLMDELGRAEKDATSFASAVMQALDSDKSVWGVLQKGEYPLKSAIMARDDVTIIEVTMENREMLANHSPVV